MYEVAGDWVFAVQRGLIPGWEVHTQFGNNPDIDPGSAPEDIWAPGGMYTGQPYNVTPETIDIGSTGEDNPAGSGARAVLITGLDDDYLLASELVPTGGTSVGLFTRVFDCVVRPDAGGLGGNNVNDVSVHHTTTTSNIFAVISANQGQSTVGAVTCPADKEMWITRTRMSITRPNGGAGSAVSSLRIREEGNIYLAKTWEQLSTAVPLQVDLEEFIYVPPRGDVLVRCEDVSDISTAFAASFGYYLIDYKGS